MKPWIKRSLFAVAGVTLLASAFTAGAFRSHHGWGPHSLSEEDASRMKGRMVERAADKLGLDGVQKAKLNALADQLQAQRLALLAGTPSPRAELTALLQGPAFDRQKAQALVDSKTAAVKTGSPALIAAFGDFYDSLKPAQQQKLRQWMDRRGHNHGGHHGEGHGENHQGTRG